VAITEVSEARQAGLGRWISGFAERQALRLQVHWSRWALDEALASGADPESDPALSLRAGQLRSKKYRCSLASTIERLVGESDSPGPPCLTSRAPVAHERVTEARETLLRVADVLRTSPTVRSRGVAIVQQLIADGGSVLYTRDHVRGAIELEARLALDCLE